MTVPWSAVVISPHSDDSVLTFGNAICELRKLGATVEVVTLFNSSDTIERHRRQLEDRAASQLLGTGLRFGAFTDAFDRLRSHAGSNDVNVVFDAVVQPGLVENVAEFIEPLLVGADLVLCPLGIGGHIDHLTAAAAVRLVNPSNTLWGFDFPYSVRYWRQDAARVVWPKVLLPVASEMTNWAYQFKSQAILCYQSQLRSLWDTEDQYWEEFSRFHAFSAPQLPRTEPYLCEGRTPEFCLPVRLSAWREDWIYRSREVEFSVTDRSS